MNRKIILAVLLALVLSGYAEAAAVSGRDDWHDLREETELTAKNPAEIHGKIRVERDTFSGPDDYPATFGESQTNAEAQIDLRLRFAQNWYVKSKLQGNVYWLDDDTEEEFDTKQLYIDGKIGTLGIRAGKIPVFDALNLTNGGLVIDSEVTGGQLKIPSGNWSFLLGGGTIDNDDYDLTRTTVLFDTDSTLMYFQAYGDIARKWGAAFGVYNMYNSAGGLRLPNGMLYSPGKKGFFESGTEKNNTVFSAGLDYRFDDKWTLGALYSGGSAKITPQAQKNARESTDEENSYSFQLTYGHPEIRERHNTAVWTAYRQAGRIGSYTPAYQGVGFGEKGFELGVRHQFFDNLALSAVYFDGQKISRLLPPAPDREEPDIHNFFIGLEYEF